MVTKSATLISFLCLSFPLSGLATAATWPTKTNPSDHASAVLPAALRPALYQALAHDADPAYAIGRNGCTTLPKQRLTGCFTADGSRFFGTDTRTLALRLSAWGRGDALHAVSAVIPAIVGNRVNYVYGALTEWWRKLPMGFEQGFTITKRPAGVGALILALGTDGEPVARDGAVAVGKLRYGQLVVTDAAGKVVPSTLTTQAGRILIVANDASARYPLTVDPLVWTEQKVTASDGAANDALGFSVALSGDIALIGAPYATVNGQTGQGAAYAFTELDGTWSQTAKLTASDGTTDSFFGFWVALSGNTALIGANFADEGGNTNQGAAYVFTDSNGTWSQTAKLTASDGAAGDQFGRQVALLGDTALIGGPFADVGGNANQGAAYVFTDSNGTWSQTAKLTASDGAAGDRFGRSVALASDSALVGAPYGKIGRNFNQGAAYAFTKSGGTWSQTAKLTARNGKQNDLFGWAVARSGNTALVGAPFADEGGNTDQGATYVFARLNGTWSQTAKLTDDDGANGYFGRSVALLDNTALIGAPYATVDGNTDQGEAYVFTKSNGAWNRAAKLIASDGAAGDRFGRSVAFAGSIALIGAPGAAVGGNAGRGAAYLYSEICPQGYAEHDGTLNAGELFLSPAYQAPAGLENGILGGPGGFQLYAQYSNDGSQRFYRIPGNEIHNYGPAGTYRWGVKAGGTDGDYVLCILHP